MCSPGPRHSQCESFLNYVTAGPSLCLSPMDSHYCCGGGAGLALSLSVFPIRFGGGVSDIPRIGVQCWDVAVRRVIATGLFSVRCLRVQGVTWYVTVVCSSALMDPLLLCFLGAGESQASLLRGSVVWWAREGVRSKSEYFSLLVSCRQWCEIFLVAGKVT